MIKKQDRRKEKNTLNAAELCLHSLAVSVHYAQDASDSVIAYCSESIDRCVGHAA